LTNPIITCGSYPFPLKAVLGKTGFISQKGEGRRPRRPKERSAQPRALPADTVRLRQGYGGTRIAGTMISRRDAGAQEMTEDEGKALL